jgi:Cellulase (glycosyl hydrolase family 5)
MSVTRLGRVGWRRGWRPLLAGTALVLAASGTAMASASSAAARPPVTVSPCAGNKVVGPFVTSGAHVYTNGGAGHHEFYSYGPTLAATLDGKSWTSADAKLVAADKATDEKEIVWAANDWCSNTVRVQVNQDLLFTKHLGIDQSYLHAIETEVLYAINHKLVVVLNDSTESSANNSNELGPTKETLFFWEEMAKIYGRVHGPHGIDGPEHVIFDLFNEPRNESPGMSQSVKWQLWYSGFDPAQPINYPYYGMEILAEWVRFDLGAPNLLWIEGPDFSDSFAGMWPKYRITVSNVVYAIHHPTGAHDASNWDQQYGYLLNQKHAPVVEGEWTNHELGKPGTNSACWPDAYTGKSVQHYLSYLTTEHIGLSAFTLTGNYLLFDQKNVNPLQPRIIDKHWNCAASGEGAGLDIYNFFKARNQKH